MRTVLSAALTRAVREELIVRNVARLAELPPWQRGTICPWSADEAKRFLAAAKADPLYVAFVLLLLYGLRRGETLGIRWRTSTSTPGPSTSASSSSASAANCASARSRPVPDNETCRYSASSARRSSSRPNTRPLTARHGLRLAATDLVFTTRTGRPVEPRNFVRSFRRICEDNKHPGHQGAPRPAHRRVAAQGLPSRPRRPDDPRARPDQHDAGDLHPRRRRGPQRGTHRARQAAHQRPKRASWSTRDGQTAAIQDLGGRCFAWWSYGGSNR